MKARHIGIPFTLRFPSVLLNHCSLLRLEVPGGMAIALKVNMMVVVRIRYTGVVTGARIAGSNDRAQQACTPQIDDAKKVRWVADLTLLQDPSRLS